MEYGKKRLIDLLLTIDEEASLLVSPNDQQDLESPAMLEAIDWSKLDLLVYSPDEARASTLSPKRYREMVATYEDYARRHNHAPNA